MDERMNENECCPSHIYFDTFVFVAKKLLQRDQACAINLWCALCQMVSSGFRTWAFCILFCGRGSKISGIVKFFGFHHTLCCFAVGDSKPNGQEDISPYATFHLLGMREEAKNNGMVANAANFQTMPHGPQQPAQQQVNNPSMAPTTPRHMSQTMNVSLFLLIFYFLTEKKSLAITQKVNHT